MTDSSSNLVSDNALWQRDACKNDLHSGSTENVDFVQHYLAGI